MRIKIDGDITIDEYVEFLKGLLSRSLHNGEETLLHTPVIYFKYLDKDNEVADFETKGGDSCYFDYFCPNETEVAVIELDRNGLSSKEIAEQLGITPQKAGAIKRKLKECYALMMSEEDRERIFNKTS